MRSSEAIAPWQTRCLEILEPSRAGDKTSKAVDIFLTVLIISNVIAVTLESIASVGARYETAFNIFEWISIGIFTLEYGLRLWANGAKTDSKYVSAFRRRLDYMISFNGVIDLLAILPSLISFMVAAPDMRWLRVMRVMRLLKLSNYSRALEDFISAIRGQKRSFLAAMYLFCILLFAASALIYIAEQPSQPDVFSSIPDSLWWAFITITTVGYGDVTPITPLGKIIAAFTAMLGIFTLALLTGLVANSFAQQIIRREMIFEAEVSSALSDGIITEYEMKQIEALRLRFNIDQDHARAIIETLSDLERNHRDQA